MPRTCTICTHGQRPAIDEALVSGESYRYVSERFTISVGAIQRHKAAHIPQALVKAHAAQQDADAIDIMAELRRSLARVNLLFDACDRWLRDADDPSRYDIGPRAHDVLVTYTEKGGDGKPIRKKTRLSYLLAKSGVDVESTETKYTDPRLLVLRTSAQLQSNLELLAKLIGQLDERPQVNILVLPEWEHIRYTMLRALQPYPEARAAVADALRVIDARR